ncbi:hypothetical protein [Amycolatopsis sp. cmx-4-54]|uniref:hypothetical protein n=1 Tax=Amycolatopsis sp. cmx-4-54 TaxID=2790936 RepID=UPI00397B7BA9
MIARITATLTELAAHQGELADDVLGRVEGATAVVAAAREFERTLRAELRSAGYLVHTIGSESGRLLLETQAIDHENSQRIGRHEPC